MLLALFLPFLLITSNTIIVQQCVKDQVNSGHVLSEEIGANGKRIIIIGVLCHSA